MRSATWKSDNGHILHFGHDPRGSFLFGNIDGNSVSGKPQSDSAPQQDGQTTYGATLGPRKIVLNGTIQGIGNPRRDAQAALDETVSKLYAAFNPKHEGELTYHLYERDVSIRCRPDAFPVIQDRIFSHTAIMPFSVDFTADSPYWHDSAERIIPLGVMYPVMRFPLFVNIDGGSPSGLVYNLLNAYNPTYEQIYPIIEVFGSTELVRVDNTTTGKHIKINHTVGADQKMVIDTANNRVDLYQQDGDGTYQFLVNATNWLTKDSGRDWPFTLQPGDNLLKINDEITADSPVSVLRYYIPVMGVVR